MSAEQQQQQQQQKPMRYGDLDDIDDDEYLSDDEPRQNGGSAADDEEARAQRAADMKAAQDLPANVKNFVVSLKNAMSSSNIAQIHNLYTSSFPRLTNEHYATVEWPEVEVVSCLVDNNEVFAIFYRELYFRHIYSRLQPNIDDRFSSYENYCAIFNYILNSDGPVPIELPVQWLWDLVDEFVWQFASFSQWRSRPKGKTEEEMALLAENPQVWSCYSVLNVLYSLIQKSKVQDQLRATKRGDENVDEIAGEYGSKPLYRTLGMYSMITLVRVHALLGDYTLALKMLDDVDMKRLPTRDVPAAHVSVHYYVGFSYLMLQRYSDAIYHLSKGYLFYAGPKRGQRNAPSGSDAIAKQADRMLALLAVAHALSASKWEDSREVREARDALRMSEKYNEQFETMSRGGQASLPVFEELFKYGAPKTISPHSPPYDSPAELEAYPDTVQHTISLFMTEVKTIVDAPDLRTLLKLYTSIGTQKLAKLAGKDEDLLLRELLVLKGSMVSTKWTEGAASEEGAGLLSGEEVVVGNLGFNIDGDSINVTESRRAKQFTGRFLSQGLAAKGLLDSLRSRPLPAPVVAGQQQGGQAASASASAASSQPSQSRPQPAIGGGPAGAKGVAWAGVKA